MHPNNFDKKWNNSKNDDWSVNNTAPSVAASAASPASTNNKSTGSASSLSKLQDREYDTLQYRVNFAKTLIQNTALDNIVDYDNTETENFITFKESEKYKQKGYNEFHTKTKLGKKKFNLYNIIPLIGGTLHYIKSGSTGHTFKGFIYDDETGEKFYYALKVAAYAKDNYGEYTDIRRPENAEICMIKLLSYFIIKKETPHIILPIGTFNTSIKPFVGLINDGTIELYAKDENGAIIKDREGKPLLNRKARNYIKFVDKYNKRLYNDSVSVLISEWANRGDLADFLRKNYETLTLIEWKVLFFQIISVLAVIQSKYPSFRHNDMKANNILLHKNKPKNRVLHHSYKLGETQFYVDNINYIIKLWDFDFACIPELVDNNKVNAKWTSEINVDPVPNRYYDLHYFFNTLIREGFLPQLLKDEIIPDEVKLFVKRVVPRKYRYFVTNDEAYYNENVPPIDPKENKYRIRDYKMLLNDRHLQNHPKYASYIGNVHPRGRLLVNDEYLVPIDVLKEDPFFAQFREIPSYIKNKQSAPVSNINNSNIRNPIYPLGQISQNTNQQQTQTVQPLIGRTNFIKI
jgi:hypothetical protein